MRIHSTGPQSLWPRLWLGPLPWQLKIGYLIVTSCTRERDEQVAKRFLTKAIRRHDVPETITVEGSEANAAAIRSYNTAHGTAISIRQVKYLNNIAEQDHRAVKRITRPLLGFKSFEAAQCTVAGIELMHMLKKKQQVVKAGEESLSAAEQFYALAS
jgi:putative transposase